MRDASTVGKFSNESLMVDRQLVAFINQSIGKGANGRAR